MSLRFPRAIAAILFVFSAAGAQVPDTTFNTTAAGRRVRDYIVAFNSGSDSTMRAYFALNLSAEAAQRIPIERRVERYREMRSMAGSFTVKKILSLKDEMANLVVEAKDGIALTMKLRCDAAPPFGLQVIEIQQSRPADEGIAPMKNDEELVAAVEAYLRDLAGTDRFSGAVLVARKGDILFQRAYGYANVEKRLPNTVATRFNLGSMNKSFTQVAVSQLADRGKLSWSDTIGKFLPAYPNADAAKKVTVQQLIDMSSGIGDFFNERYEVTPKSALRTIGGYLPLFADKPLEFEPGTNRKYSNGGYVVLGAIIEAASGMDYYTYVRQKIFVPAGMMSTESFDKDTLPADAAIGYTRGRDVRKEGPRQANYDALPQRGSSAGGGYSNVSDLLRYTAILSDRSVVPSTFRGTGGLGIAGGMDGVNAALEWDPGTGYTVIVLANLDPPAAESVAQRIRAWLPAR
jgi:CubicO group peptidase (beta-lactamase class C family)